MVLPQNLYVEVLMPAFQNVTLFEKRVITEVEVWLLEWALIPYDWCLFFFLMLYLFFRERQRESKKEQGRGRERVGRRI